MLEKIKNSKVIVACSGGPDSMALLDILVKLGGHVSVAHVNYHKRDSALRDENIVRDYCNKYMLKYYHKDAYGFDSGNFQDWARKVRYQFFKECITEDCADYVCVAHHFDDLLETYCIQKNRGSIPTYWGIQKETSVEGVPILRPLLKYTKQECEEYCVNNHVAFGIDESNLSSLYTRNRIRKELALLSISEKNKIKDEIDDRNLKLQNLNLIINEYINKKLVFDELMQFEYKEELLMMWIKKYANVQMSSHAIKDILKQLNTTKNVEIKLDKCVKLSKEYNILEISEIKDVSYTYVLDKLELLSGDFFTLQLTGSKIEGITLSESDFPLTIRNAKQGDEIKLRLGTKKLSRWFIDRKIPKEERKTWPVLVNSSGDVIFVAKIGCDIKHYSNNPTCFMIK